MRALEVHACVVIHSLRNRHFMSQARRTRHFARNECEALFFSSPRFTQNATLASLSLGPGSALEEKRKKIDERGESFLAFFAHWGALSQASLVWLI